MARIRPRRRYRERKVTWRAEPVPPAKTRLINRTTQSTPLPPHPPPPTFPKPAPHVPGWCCDCGGEFPGEHRPNICLPNQPCCAGTDGQGILVVDNFPPLG